MATASAPGKIILFGEHAVVYGQPAIAVPLQDVRAQATVTANPEGRTRVVSEKIGLDVFLDECSPGFWGLEVVHGVQRLFNRASIPPFTMHIESTIPVASGMGSGAAVAVASIRALAMFLEEPISDEQVNQAAYEIERLHHGTPSGIDNTVIAFCRPVYFIREKTIETFRPAVPFTFVIADTGIPSPTALSVGDVRRAWLSDPPRYNAMFEHIGAIVNAARAVMESGDQTALGPLMDENQRWLYEIGVSSPALERLIHAAHEAGAAGAKLSGGGRGGNLLALVEPARAERIAAALRAAGAVRTIITTVGP